MPNGSVASSGCAPSTRPLHSRLCAALPGVELKSPQTTMGISAEAARDILDRLETPEPEKSPHARTADAPASEAVPEARCTLLVRGAPGASANAAELFLYRAFAPHGAVVSVRSTSGSITAEHVVQFRRAAEADAARRALDGGALGALRVTALDAP